MVGSAFLIKASSSFCGIKGSALKLVGLGFASAGADLELIILLSEFQFIPAKSFSICPIFFTKSVFFERSNLALRLFVLFSIDTNRLAAFSISFGEELESFIIFFR